MDLDDIDQWSRELLQKEARKRGIANASLYSRPELIKLILRHDYADSPKNVRDAAKLVGELIGTAKTALLHGFSSAVKAKQKLGVPGRRADDSEQTYAPRQSWGEAVPPYAAEARGGSERDGVTARAFREARERGSSERPVPAAPEAPQPIAEAPAVREVPAAGEVPPAMREVAAARVDPKPELRPPARDESDPLELSAALREAEAAASHATVDAASPAAARVDPNPELRPPAAAGFPPHAVSLRVSTPPPRDDAGAALEFSIPAAAKAPSPASATPATPATPATDDAAPRDFSPWASMPPPARADAPPIVPLTAAAVRAPERQVELEPLPPGTDQLRHGPHPEHGLFLRWQVTPDAVARARAVLGSSGELAVRIVAVRVDARAVVHTEVLDHGPIEPTGDWTAPVPASAGRYVSSIGVRTPERFVSIVHAEN